ncbi:MAG TPA: MBL fold metallo-hydrolase [Phototrophicaceae bacterium]|nr:MBL fold metallo-hydrolase [Phototrophicaceae bacterium]
MNQDSYRLQIGAINGRVIRDASEPLTQVLIESIFIQDRERMVAEWQRLLQPEEFSRNVLYLETSTNRILIDAGEGDSNARLPGRLLETLRAEGIDPASIDTVILTHCHVDHFGGLVAASGTRCFPNARVIMSRVEYDYWVRDDVLANLKPERAARLQQVFALYPLEWAEGGMEVAPGITLIAAPGHTPGNLAVLIESQGERLLHLVDGLHMTLQFRAPDAVPRFDLQPGEAIKTRLALLDRAEEERLLVMAYHLTFPGLGYVQRNGLKQRMWTAYHNRQDVPDYLLETYDVLACAYPNRIPDDDYWAVIALIHPYMSFRTLADVLSALTDKSYSWVYNDASGFGSNPMPLDEDIARVKQKLAACGYQAWVKKNTF